jgi:predicted transcriptional regulator
LKYRSRSEIMAQIVRAAEGGATKTQIMYKAYLSYDQVKEYLQFMLEKGLLLLDPLNQRYNLTQKSLEFLALQDRIADVVSARDGNSESQSLDPFQPAQTVHATEQIQSRKLFVY